MSNSTEAEVVAEWRAAMEGVPAGPWKWYPWHVEEGPPTVYVKEGWLLCAVPSDDHAKWVARCSPAGISGLLALIESQRATIERVEQERDEATERATSWEEQFHAAANAASVYSEFWERHVDDFDAAGNYIPHSQIDGDLRAAEARVTALEAEKAGLVAALVPFANEADARSNLVLGPDIDDWPIGGSAIKLGDLRRARQALAQPSTQENDNGR